MQTASSVETRINHDTFPVIVFTQDIRIDGTETAVVHRFDMYVSQATIRPFVHICRTLFHPTFIQQAAQGSAADGFHHFVPTGFRLRIVERNQDLLASLSIQQRRKIPLGRLSVNLLNHHTRFHLCRFPVERAFFHHFVHLHAFARVTPVIQ